MPIVNGIAYGKDAKLDYSDLLTYSQNAHDAIAATFTESNLLYNKASVIEDIVLNEFLSIYNTAKSINFSNILRKNYILESFTSQDYIDLKFPVDNVLNLDIQNGALTLPINTTANLEAESIIIESESNGQAGNSYAYDYSNADPKVILTADNATFFEYEKISDIFSTSTLYFSATIRLKAEGITNGCYVRLYSEDGNNYPSIDTLDISLDGVTWTNVNKTIDVNKADHFIRFMPKKIRFIKLRLKQDNYNVLQTAFGPKYRYSIGLREVTAKQTSYKEAGEYISIPFSSRKTIGGVAFNSDEISFNDITYYVSANNGSKWVPIKNAQTLDVISEDMGMRGEIDITQVRIKVKMDRVSSPNSATLKEFIVTNTTDQYFLKYTPISIKAMLGNHVSYGTTRPYQFTIDSAVGVVNNDLLQSSACLNSDVNTIATLFYIPYTETLLEDTEIRFNGSLLKNDGTVYTFLPHSNTEHSIISVSPALFENASSVTMALNYKPFIYDHRTTRITGSKITLPQNAFIESKEGITIEQVNFGPVSIATQETNSPDLFDNNIDTVWGSTFAGSETEWLITVSRTAPFVLGSYSIVPSVNEIDGIRLNPKHWILEAATLDAGPWIKIDEQWKAESFWTGIESKDFTLLNNKCAYGCYRVRVLENCATDTEEKKTLKMVNMNLFDAKAVKISDSSLFTVIPATETENTIVKLSESIYNPLCDYKITYMPSVKLNNYMPATWKDNSISLQSLHSPPIGSKICFEYTYEDSETIKDIDYYTPVCHEYRVELI